MHITRLATLSCGGESVGSLSCAAPRREMTAATLTTHSTIIHINHLLARLSRHLYKSMDPQQFETIKTILRNFDQRLNQLEDREIEHDLKVNALAAEVESMKKLPKSPPKPLKKYVIEEGLSSSVTSPQSTGYGARKVKLPHTQKVKAAEEHSSQPKPSPKLEYSKAQLQSIRNEVIPNLSTETKNLGMLIDDISSLTLFMFTCSLVVDTMEYM
jgi:hypothetical protein